MSDFFRIAVTFGWHTSPGKSVFHFIGDCGGETHMNSAWTDVIDRDPLRGQLDCQRTSQSNNAVLGRRIGTGKGTAADR